MDKFSKEKYVNPVYHGKEIQEADLEAERGKRLYTKYHRVAGSDSFQVMIFRPKQEYFFVSPQLCTCDLCLSLEFEK